MTTGHTDERQLNPLKVWCVQRTTLTHTGVFVSCFLFLDMKVNNFSFLCVCVCLDPNLRDLIFTVWIQRSTEETKCLKNIGGQQNKN